MRRYSASLKAFAGFIRMGRKDSNIRGATVRRDGNIPQYNDVQENHGEFATLHE